MKEFRGDKFFLWFGVALAILLGIGGMAFFSLLDLARSAEQRQRSYEFLEDSAHLIAVLLDAEASQRGYALTGQQDFLDSYRHSLNLIESPNGVAKLARDYPGHRGKLEALTSLIDRKWDFMGQVVQTREEQGLAAAQHQVATGEGVQLMDQIQQLLGEMQKEERGHLQAWDRAVQHKGQRTMLFTLLGSLLAFGLLAGAGLFLHREAQELRRAQEALQKAHDQLETRVQERTAELAQSNQDLELEIAERQQAEIWLKTSLENLHALAAHLQTVREEERTTIARELHDELGQTLTGLKMEVFGLGKRLTKALGKPDPALEEEFAAVCQLIDDSIQTTKRLATELRPGVLNLGLVAAIEWQAQQFQARTGIPCRLTLPEDIPLEGAEATALFRILQESLTNVTRHADASQVHIRLREQADHLLLDIEDNGRGITEAEKGASLSLGLMGMRERALLLGGEFTITGSPEQGTRIQVLIPRKKGQKSA